LHDVDLKVRNSPAGGHMYIEISNTSSQ